MCIVKTKYKSQREKNGEEKLKHISFGFGEAEVLPRGWKVRTLK